MKYFQEVTAWTSEKVQNHIYYLSDDKSKLVGYIKQGSESLFKFKTPINFDSRGRKFVVLNKKAESDSVYFPKVAERKEVTIKVQGSKGQIYSITKTKNETYMCSCPGFMFRHRCKHVDELKK